jgi:hypothetical protein
MLPETGIFFEGLDKFFARRPVGQISQQNPGRPAAPWSGISAALMLNLFSSRSSFGNSITSPARQLTDLVMPAIDVALRRTTIGRRIASRDDVAADLNGAHSLVGRSDKRGFDCDRAGLQHGEMSSCFPMSQTVLETRRCRNAPTKAELCPRLPPNPRSKATVLVVTRRKMGQRTSMAAAP